ncbi:NADH-ubiquinone/plastoquinone oxidoreductase chain 3 [Pirellula staleyi DSM 6068]|uniref:NADH-quinone oxidoreductase subunit n=1 Tax=Pirellula staleyi (strain ATCC 27377 / DSM 6068 / ICPB 4128) TaxID=530564 RepID=D2R4P5_PIRSD|nr:NADH-quinone oxidoreductase subunit A [Pirellula staleyi]ADB17111.1 NADH-ubiquinone/plastoquinone oxidoreductase chain 3 [Pirellula staleyi DSM 6068]
MSPAVATTLGIVAYLAVFAGVGVTFLFVNLLVGLFVRPSNPHQEKLEIYECGEPTIGSSFVQFDLRFYVVALLFIIFDVEVAFFFPWAAVFGKTTTLMKDDVQVVQVAENGELELTPAAAGIYKELGVRNPTVPTTTPPALASAVPTTGDEAAIASARIHAGARTLAWLTIIDIGAFFAVLLIGFAYVWKRGDLDWVRAVSKERSEAPIKSRTQDPLEEEAALSA